MLRTLTQPLPEGEEKIASGKTKDGHDYFINEYPATKNYSQWERVGYVQLPQGVGYIVFSSRDRASYQKDSGEHESNRVNAADTP